MINQALKYLRNSAQPFGGMQVVFAGDFFQTDLIRTNERNGLHDFLRIVENMKSFNVTEYTIADIVRSGFIREYLIEKTKLGLGMEQ